jgi:RimJ/RimL family protein N-acetyltransferase
VEPVILRTERLTLSTPVPVDRPRVYEYCQDPLFIDYMTLPWPYTANDAVFFLETLVPNGWRDEREFTWALREAPGSPLLGVVGMRVQPEPRTLDVGYWLGAPHRGNGYMAEAVRRAVEWAFDTLPVDTVLWECVAGNHASVRVAAASGFAYTGEAPARLAMRDGRHPPAWHGELLRGADSAEAAATWPAELFGATR